MKRTAIGGAVAAGVLATGAGVAYAEISDLNVDPPGDDGYVVLNANNNEVASGATGPRVGFTVEVQCDAGERVGVGVLAHQDQDGRDPAGGAGATRTCSGGDQDIDFIVQSRTGENFDSGENLTVYALAATDLDSNINDVDGSRSDNINNEN